MYQVTFDIMAEVVLFTVLQRTIWNALKTFRIHEHSHTHISINSTDYREHNIDKLWCVLCSLAT